MPKVSFIVAVYNSMPYLTKCLDSLLEQTVKDIEVICVNDCSPDNSAEIIDKYIAKDSRVRLINHITNKRQGGAWNSGVAIASGEYLCFVDADDWLEPDYAENVLNDTDADILVASNFFKGNTLASNINSDLLKRCDGDIRLYTLLYGGFFITNFIKRTFLDAISFRFVENNMYQDFMTCTLYFATDSISMFTKPGYHYRVDNVSIQRSMDQNVFWGRLEVAIMEHKAYDHLPKSLKYKEAIDMHFYKLYNQNSLIRAFYGFSNIPWDRVYEIKKKTTEIIPNIKENKYYCKRFVNYSFFGRMPIFLFNMPKPIVNGLHKIYMLVRKFVKNK